MVRLLEYYSHRVIASGTCAIVAADRLRADLLRVCGRIDEAIALARVAIEASRARGTVLFEAYELAVLAEALRDAGDHGGASRCAAQSHEIAERIGTRYVLDRISERSLLG